MCNSKTNNKKEYALFIPFKLKGYGKLKSKNSEKITINNLDYSLGYSENFNIPYFYIESFESKDSAESFYEEFKSLLRLNSFIDSYLLFDFNENMVDAEEIPKNAYKYVKSDYIINKCETSIIPLINHLKLWKQVK